MRTLDFGSWQTLLPTLLGLAVFTLVGVGIRLLILQTVQVRRERENRQINERLRTLIAAYKILGGSFTGDLFVDPTHLRDLQRKRESELDATDVEQPLVSGERSRRVRDAVEAALSDILLLGTEAQVHLAAKAATELVAGRPVETAELVVSLRDFIRQVLELEPVPTLVPIPKQGPTRPNSSKGKGDGNKDGRQEGGGKSGGGMKGAMGGAMGGGMGGAPLLGGGGDEEPPAVR